jgi:very-short-patch-repair endonuclease
VPETRSELERRFLDFCREEGLPAPATNVLVAGMMVDAAWMAARLVVELDGWEFHRMRGAFERDRARDMRLQRAGLRVLRVTSRRLRDQRTTVPGTIRDLLSQAEVAGEDAGGT